MATFSSANRYHCIFVAMLALCVASIDALWLLGALGRSECAMLSNNATASFVSIQNYSSISAFALSEEFRQTHQIVHIAASPIHVVLLAREIGTNSHQLWTTGCYDDLSLMPWHQISILAPCAGVTSVVAGHGFTCYTCAEAPASVQCVNHRGTRAVPETIDAHLLPSSTSLPSSLTTLGSQISHLTAGERHVCALSTIIGDAETTYDVSCFGRNHKNQCGVDSTSDQWISGTMVHVPEARRVMPSSNRDPKFSCRFDQCAIVHDEAATSAVITAWGNNAVGNLGTSSEPGIAYPPVTKSFSLDISFSHIHGIYITQNAINVLYDIFSDAFISSVFGNLMFSPVGTPQRLFTRNLIDNPIKASINQTSCFDDSNSIEEVVVLQNSLAVLVNTGRVCFWGYADQSEVPVPSRIKYMPTPAVLALNDKNILRRAIETRVQLIGGGYEHLYIVFDPDA